MENSFLQLKHFMTEIVLMNSSVCKQRIRERWQMNPLLSNRTQRTNRTTLQTAIFEEQVNKSR